MSEMLERIGFSVDMPMSEMEMILDEGAISLALGDEDDREVAMTVRDFGTRYASLLGLAHVLSSGRSLSYQLLLIVEWLSGLSDWERLSGRMKKAIDDSISMIRDGVVWDITKHFGHIGIPLSELTERERFFLSLIMLEMTCKRGNAESTGQKVAQNYAWLAYRQLIKALHEEG